LFKNKSLSTEKENFFNHKLTLNYHQQNRNTAKQVAQLKKGFKVIGCHHFVSSKKNHFVCTEGFDFIGLTRSIYIHFFAQHSLPFLLI
jgi:hypothetical protein